VRFSRGRIAGVIGSLVVIVSLLAWGAGAPARTPQGNRAVARSDASALLASLRLPSGSTRLAREPPGDGGWLKPLPMLIGETPRYTAHAWWRVDASPGDVQSYIRAHPPVGSQPTGTGSGGNTRTGSRSWTLDYTWPPRRGVLGARELQVTITALPGSAAGVLAESQSTWVVARPRSEEIPAGIGEVDIASHKPGQPSSYARVTDAGKVGRLVAIFDRMPIVQPGVFSCPALIAGGRVVTFAFRSGVGGPAVAQASFTEFPHFRGVSGQCTPVELRIHGRRQRPLIGGQFIRRIERLLGIDLRS
jgi:hypothetical protein